ncbi:MAG: beta-lactamase family protein [Chitinophagaceae bacterium]|nr:beta-lactamase family protein [Chitinophagaceae bacterium]
MKKYLPALFIVLSTGTAHAQSLTQKMDSFMQAANRAQLFNGVVLVARHDSILYAKGWGWRDAENKVPHDTNSIFLIGSVTKPFTATLIMDLQERGYLRLTDRIGKYFPDYKYGNMITIENLLDHSSGIFEYSKDAEFMSWVTRGHFTEKEFWERFGEKPLDFTPGTKFGYSNTAYMVLGYLAQKVTGRTYWDLIRQRIFQRAGMTHSGFDYIGLSSPFKSVGYDSLYDPDPAQAGIVDSTYSFSAGAIYSTVGDMYRWSQALFGGQLISPEDLERSVQIHRVSGSWKYGYGWTMDSAIGKRLIFHEGGNFGFASLISNIPQDQACIVLLTNNRDRIANARPCYIGLLQILYDQPYVLPRKAIALLPAVLQEYTGDYELEDKKEFKGLIAWKNGQLSISWNGAKADELYAEKRDLLFLKAYDLQLSFTRDAQGKVTGFTAYSGGKAFVYHKVGS